MVQAPARETKVISRTDEPPARGDVQGVLCSAPTMLRSMRPQQWQEADLRELPEAAADAVLLAGTLLVLSLDQADELCAATDS